MTHVVVDNYYDNTKLDITLDPKLDPKANAQKYYQKYQKTIIYSYRKIMTFKKEKTKKYNS